MKNAQQRGLKKVTWRSNCMYATKAQKQPIYNFKKKERKKCEPWLGLPFVRPSFFLGTTGVEAWMHGH
jgi:hypothetical protein